MKRYRWLSFFIDTERNIVRQPPYSSDPMAVSGAVGSVAERHGLRNIQAKYSRWLELSPPGLCVPVAYHELLLEVEAAYVHGDCYPALTAACCLGERVLNQLLLDVRDDFRSSPRYKEVYDKASFQNWELAIGILVEWGVLKHKVAAKFRELLELRNPVVHFGSVADRVAQGKTAVQLLYDATAALFGTVSGNFFVCQGEVFVVRDRQDEALVRRLILPHCHLVGYQHRIEGTPPQLIDDGAYEAGEITDDEFCARREQYLTLPSNDKA